MNDNNQLQSNIATENKSNPSLNKVKSVQSFINDIENNNS